MRKIVLSWIITLGMSLSLCAQQANINARKLQLALFAISNLYVDSTSETKLVEDAIVGMLEKLDPHSTYMDPEETKEMNEPLQGNFDGIGIQFNMLTDTVYVIQVIPGGPSEKVGLMAGDRIIDRWCEDEDDRHHEAFAWAERYGGAREGETRRKSGFDGISDHSWKDSDVQLGCGLYGG